MLQSPVKVLGISKMKVSTVRQCVLLCSLQLSNYETREINMKTYTLILSLILFIIDNFIDYFQFLLGRKNSLSFPER